ncbi:phosphate ABC transporter substrate-binding protein PstS family protein [Heliobacillus mobilis]|uniref:Phosphate-binding protein n=1 Tax=Heliobacterium mobile TaxID=28064 RepID=Q0PIC7_HELMO|nr:phosphate ABC transporter substrate-binding protein [Heliobacterium mobile]ABH04890.1 ABC-type phosphate transporter phosphate-binding protein pstS [Heliobacterium mobile]MTV47588.1 phosphate ABC transporter substrate-binding protein PstS family protein [Heliobacterium mobile]
MNLKKFSKLIALTAMVGLLGTVAVGCGGNSAKETNADKPAASAQKGSIQVKGSDTIVNLSQKMAETYMEKNKDANIAVTGGGSGTGIKALINGTTDLANASREMKDEEKQELKEKTGKDTKEIVIARDGIGFIVNKNNPVKELTMDQLSDIYTGKVSNWKELGGPDEKIVVYARETSSGTHVFIKEHVMKNKDYRTDALLQSSNAAIVKEVEANKGAIGYVGLGYLKDTTKTLGVKKDGQSAAVMPSEASVKDKSYPVSRPLFVYAAGEPEGLAKSFVDFMLSDEGQQIVKSMDFVSAK